jgi:hypothetical protein
MKGRVEDGHEKGEHLPSVDNENDGCKDSKDSCNKKSRVNSNLFSQVLEGSNFITIGV